MAKRYGSYTPKRQAALRRAQLISANKRRGRKRNITVGVLAGGVALGAIGGTLVAHRYASALKGGPNPPAHIATPQLALTVGHGKPNIVYTRRHVKKKARIVVPGAVSRTTARSIFTVSKSGVVKRTTKGRLIYDQNRRRGYWQGKRVGGGRKKR